MEKFRFFVKKELKSRFVDLLRHQTPNEFIEELRMNFLPTPLVTAFSRFTEQQLDIYMDYVHKYQGKRAYLTDERVTEMLNQMRVAHPEIYKIMAPAIKDISKRLKQMSDESRHFYEYYLQQCSDINFESNESFRQYFLSVLARWTQLEEAHKKEFAKFFPNVYKVLTDTRLYLWTGFGDDQVRELHRFG